MVAAGDEPGLADRHELSIDVGGSRRVTIVQTHLRVKKQRGPRRFEGRIQQARSIRCCGRHEHIDARQVRGDRLHRLRMEGAQPGTITAAGSHDDYRTSPFADRAPMHRAQFRHDLIRAPPGRKSVNCKNATGRDPAKARPMLTPMIVASLSGELTTRPGNAVDKPRVTRKHLPSDLRYPRRTGKRAVRRPAGRAVPREWLRAS